MFYTCSIKSIRICQPQEHNSSRSSKGDIVISNKVRELFEVLTNAIMILAPIVFVYGVFFLLALKLHALVEYENAETAERAVCFLSDFSIICINSCCSLFRVLLMDSVVERIWLKHLRLRNSTTKGTGEKGCESGSCSSARYVELHYHFSFMLLD